MLTAATIVIAASYALQIVITRRELRAHIR